MTLPPPIPPSTPGLPAWTKALDAIAAHVDELSLVVRIASYTNQFDLTRRLAESLNAAREFAVNVTLIGKPESGVRDLGQRFQAAPPIRATVIEVPVYAAIDVAELTASANVLVFAVPALAPFYDETAEFIATKLAGLHGILILLATTGGNPFSRELPPALQDLHCYTDNELLPPLLDLLAQRDLASLEAGLRANIASACGELIPVVDAFAEFLGMSQAQFRRRLEFIWKDLSALQELAQKVHQTLEAQSRKAISQLASITQSLSQTMRVQATTAVQNATVTRDVLGNQDARTRFGQQLAGAARTAGYQEFQTRVQSLALDLNSANSVLLSTIDRLRLEAQGRLEELTFNIGPGVTAAWLSRSDVQLPANPLDFSCQPPSGFPERVAQSALQVRLAILETPFASGWASRIETLYRDELVNAATAGWNPSSLDQPLSAAIGNLWTDSATPAGLLLARLNAIAAAISQGLASVRLASLDLPGDPSVRANLGDAYRKFSADLIRLQQTMS